MGRLVRRWWVARRWAWRQTEGDGSRVMCVDVGAWETHQPEVLAFEARGGSGDGADVPRLLASHDDHADVLERRGGVREPVQVLLPRALREAASAAVRERRSSINFPRTWARAATSGGRTSRGRRTRTTRRCARFTSR